MDEGGKTGKRRGSSLCLQTQRLSGKVEFNKRKVITEPNPSPIPPSDDTHHNNSCTLQFIILKCKHFTVQGTKMSVFESDDPKLVNSTPR